MLVPEMPIIQALAALVPKPRDHLIHLPGVFAPNGKYRALVTPAKPGKGKEVKVPEEKPDQTAAECRTSMTRDRRLKRVFDIDIAYMDVGKEREHMSRDGR